MEGRGGGVAELEDWEVLHNSDVAIVNSEEAVVDSARTSFVGIEVDAEGMIRSDYFSLDNQGKYGYGKAVADVSEEGSVESDNPSWIDPASLIRYGRKESGGFWSDSGSDPSDDRKSNDFEVNNELGFPGNEKSQVRFGGKGEMEADDENFGKLESGESKLSGLEGKVSFEEIGEKGSVDKDSGKFWSDSGGDSLVSGKFEKAVKENEISFSGLDGGNNLNTEPADEQSVERQSIESESAAVEEVKPEAKSGGEVVKRPILWWKVPCELLKYCVFRVSPVWSISVAAAVVGLVFLGRRLSKMKRKSQTLQLKVTLDDKKVSQFMSRTARLNEAFSVVKRVPLIRPSLPAAGVNPWPVLSLR